MNLTIEVGSTATHSARFSFGIAIVDRTGYVTIYASDPGDGRKAGVFMRADRQAWDQFRAMVQKVDATIEQLSGSGQMLPLP